MNTVTYKVLFITLTIALTFQSHAGFETYEEYFYESCQHFNSDEEREYELTCVDGQEVYEPLNEAQIKNLTSPLKQLTWPHARADFFKQLKEFILQKLEKNTLTHLDLRDCIIMHMNRPDSVTQECRQKVKSLREITKTGHPLLRKNMSLKNGISPTGKIDEDIDHAHVANEIAPLNRQERDELQEDVNRILKEQKEIIFNKYKGLSTRAKTKRRFDEYAKVRRDIQAQAEKNYNTLLNEAPFLAFIERARVPETEAGVDVTIINSLDTMKNHAMDEYFKWKDKPAEDFSEFFKYPHVLNSFMESWPGLPSQNKCDVIEDLHRTHGPGGTDEIIETVGYVTAALVGGGLCAVTAGLGCAVAVAIGTEAMAISSTQQYLDQTISLSQSGLVTSQEVSEAESQRNLSLALAPLSFVGLKGGTVLKSSHALKRPVARPASIYIKRFISQSPTTPEQNAKWIQRARSDQSGLFLDVENAALKRLNDTLGDKNLVTALTNHHKEILFRKLDILQMKYPKLEILKYSDFKSSRFSFAGEIPENLQSELNTIFEETNKEFASLLSKSPELKIPPQENPSQWFNAGIGKSADQAGLAARQARRQRDGSSQFIALDKVKLQLSSDMSSIEQKRLTLTHALKDYPHLLSGNDTKKIPSIEVFEVLRKAKSLAPEELAALFQKRFNANLSSSTAKMLKDYADEVDQFSPGIWIEQRVVANLDDASQGGFSVDFKGMGARNVHQVAQDLMKSESVDEAISNIRKGEGIVTEQFDSAKSGFQKLVSDSLSHFNIPITTKCSGDDCVSIPQAILPDVAKEKMMDSIARTANPSGYRLSFIPPNVTQQSRTELAVHGELIEKQVRKELTGYGAGRISPQLLDKITIALDMPAKLGDGEVRLLVKPAPGVDITQEQIKTIQEYLPQAVTKVNKEVSQETGRKVLYRSGGIDVWR